MSKRNPRPTKAGDSVKNLRFQVELTSTQHRKICRLQKECGSASKKDLFNNALTVVEWLVSEKRLGRPVGSMDLTSNSFKELVMPFLEHACAVADEEAGLQSLMRQN